MSLRYRRVGPHSWLITLKSVPYGEDGIQQFRRGATMSGARQFTAIIERDENLYVALCPELDITSQGTTVEEARTNLQEAIELFFESASPEEIHDRLHNEIFITRVEVEVA
jgi:predicted RNase H-like HicB family nuclease